MNFILSKKEVIIIEDIGKYLNITLKIFTILPMVLFLTLKSGRRKIGELPVFDFIVIITLGSIIGADISDPSLKYLPTAYAIIIVILFQDLVGHLKIKYRKFAKITTFGPTVVIQNGQFLHDNMKRLKYTTENIMMFLREKDIFDLNEVEFAIIEDNGKLSVLKKSQYLNVTPDDLNIETNYKGLSLPVIIEGEVHEHNLKNLNLSKDWLRKELKKAKVDNEKDVFYAEINTEGQLYISKKIKVDGLSNDFKIC